MSKTDHAPSRITLFVPFVILLILVVLHAVYWTFAASRIETQALGWIEAQQEAGYEVSYDNLRVGGYPFRFALRAQNPILTAPEVEGGWTAKVERLSATAQFYNLSHWIVALDGEGQVINGSDTYTLNADSARLSFRASNGATSRVGATIEALTIEGSQGANPAITSAGRLVVSGYVSEANILVVGIQGDNVVLAEDSLDPALESAFSRSVSLMRVDAQVTEWSALARRADPFDWREADGTLVINDTRLIWGPAELAGNGEIVLDGNLLPEGRLSIVVTDPETLIGALEAAGIVVDEQGQALRLAAMMAPREDRGIRLPLRLREGGVFFGPARIGTFAKP